MLYKEEILDHYRHPQNFGKLKNATHGAAFTNASCGDEISIELVLEGGTITSAAFTGRGCAMSVAAASVLTELIKGKTLIETKKLNLGDIVNLIGEVNPGRQKCVLLPLRAINLALASKDAPTTDQSPS